MKWKHPVVSRRFNPIPAASNGGLYLMVSSSFTTCETTSDPKHLKSAYNVSSWDFSQVNVLKTEEQVCVLSTVLAKTLTRPVKNPACNECFVSGIWECAESFQQVCVCVGSLAKTQPVKGPACKECVLSGWMNNNVISWDFSQVKMCVSAV